jgi:hypothetical protein
MPSSRTFTTLLPAILAFAIACPSMASDRVTIKVSNDELISYQATPLSTPKGGAAFQGSNFIHPLKTPSGFIVTDCQPDDHKHHFGLWWPWKFIQTGNRKILCWELQKGDDLIQAAENAQIQNGLITKSIYIDRNAPDGAVTLLNETTTITVSDILKQPTTGYFLDLKITQQTESNTAITIPTHHYSGFSLRGTPAWNHDNSTILTSEGKERLTANFSHARWVKVEGKTDSSEDAGIILMSHLTNQAHPEKLRTWDTQYKGAVFINFNTVADKGWRFEPHRKYSRRYRAFVYDGQVSATEAEVLWKTYASTTE